jgi:hypothetical protein
MELGTFKKIRRKTSHLLKIGPKYEYPDTFLPLATARNILQLDNSAKGAT